MVSRVPGISTNVVSSNIWSLLAISEEELIPQENPVKNSKRIHKNSSKKSYAELFSKNAFTSPKKSTSNKKHTISPLTRQLNNLRASSPQKQTPSSSRKLCNPILLNNQNSFSNQAMTPPIMDRIVRSPKKREIENNPHQSPPKKQKFQERLDSSTLTSRRLNFNSKSTKEYTSSKALTIQDLFTRNTEPLNVKADNSSFEYKKTPPSIPIQQISPAAFTSQALTIISPNEINVLTDHLRRRYFINPTGISEERIYLHKDAHSKHTAFSFKCFKNNKKKKDTTGKNFDKKKLIKYTVKGPATFFPDFANFYEDHLENSIINWVLKGADTLKLHVTFPNAVGADSGRETDSVEIYYNGVLGSHIRPKFLD